MGKGVLQLQNLRGHKAKLLHGPVQGWNYQGTVCNQAMIQSAESEPPQKKFCYEDDNNENDLGPSPVSLYHDVDDECNKDNNKKTSVLSDVGQLPDGATKDKDVHEPSQKVSGVLLDGNCLSDASGDKFEIGCRLASDCDKNNNYSPSSYSDVDSAIDPEWLPDVNEVINDDDIHKACQIVENVLLENDKDDTVANNEQEDCLFASLGETANNYIPLAHGDVNNVDDSEWLTDATLQDDISIINDSDDCDTESVDLPVLSKVKNTDKTYLKDAPHVFFCNTKKTILGVTGKIKKTDRVYDVKHYCLYCEKPYVKIPEHLRAKHPTEHSVQQWLEQQSTKEKMAKLSLIRNEGDDIHNRNVVQMGNGELIVGRKPKGDKDIYLSDVRPCPGCALWVFNLRKHKANCPGTAKQVQVKPAECSDLLFDEVIDKLLNDELSRILVSDKYIILLGNKSISVQGNKVRRGNYTSTKLRRCAELLKEMRNLGLPTLTWETALNPMYYDVIIQAVKNVCGHITDTYTRPTTAINFKQYITQMADIKASTAIKDSNETKQKEAEDLIKLLDKNWQADINFQAKEQLRCERFNKKVRLPLQKDLMTLTDYLKEQCTNITTTVPHMYKRMVVLSQARLLVFNKRRPGELSQMTVTDFEKSKENGDDEENECITQLTDSEKLVMRYHNVVTIRGKTGRGVPVLIPRDVQPVLQGLCNPVLRQQAGVKTHYLFATQGYGVHRAYDSLRTVCQEVKLQDPESVKSTSLRKYISTFAQVLSLRKNELNYILEHMGHSYNVHMEHYRLMNKEIERSKIAKLMMLADAGKLGTYAGKSLDDIMISDEMMIKELQNEEKQKETVTTATNSDGTQVEQKSSKKYGLSAKQIEVYNQIFYPPGENPFENLKTKIEGTCLEGDLLKVKNKINSDMQKLKRKAQIKPAARKLQPASSSLE